MSVLLYLNNNQIPVVSAEKNLLKRPSVCSVITFNTKTINFM